MRTIAIQLGVLAQLVEQFGRGACCGLRRGWALVDGVAALAELAAAGQGMRPRMPVHVSARRIADEGGQRVSWLDVIDDVCGDAHALLFAHVPHEVRALAFALLPGIEGIEQGTHGLADRLAIADDDGLAPDRAGLADPGIQRRRR